MQYFWQWAVQPMLRLQKVSRVLEIGASLGDNTKKLLSGLPDAQVTVIDPCFDADLVGMFSAEPRVTVHRGTSLVVLPRLSGAYDAILIDGDHNFYTVHNELNLIAERGLLTHRGVILMHDIGPPYGRKDMFYDPASIPDSAKADGQPQGVLTAVEAFIASAAEPYVLMKWSAEHGLGCLMRRSAYRPAMRVLPPLWQSIRWRNRLLRKLGLMQRDTGRWGGPRPT